MFDFPDVGSVGNMSPDERRKLIESMLDNREVASHIIIDDPVAGVTCSAEDLEQMLGREVTVGMLDAMFTDKGDHDLKIMRISNEDDVSELLWDGGFSEYAKQSVLDAVGSEQELPDATLVKRATVSMRLTEALVTLYGLLHDDELDVSPADAMMGALLSCLSAYALADGFFLSQYGQGSVRDTMLSVDTCRRRIQDAVKERFGTDMPSDDLLACAYLMAALDCARNIEGKKDVVMPGQESMEQFLK